MIPEWNNTKVLSESSKSSRIFGIKLKLTKIRQSQMLFTCVQYLPALYDLWFYKILNNNCRIHQRFSYYNKSIYIELISISLGKIYGLQLEIQSFSELHSIEYFRQKDYIIHLARVWKITTHSDLPIKNYKSWYTWPTRVRELFHIPSNWAFPFLQTREEKYLRSFEA